MNGFHEVRFPLRVALGATAGPVRRTDIVNLSNGREQRNQRWHASRRAYDAGTGIRSLADLYDVLAFFEARRGQLYGFRFRDPLDQTSGRPHAPISREDQEIGTGDGETPTFQLVKTYADQGGSWTRPIAKPVGGTVVVAVDGIAIAGDGFAVEAATGLVTFAAGRIPSQGARITAGYAFEVPVRFDIDRIEVSLAHFDAGRIPAIPLTEILP
ncbi:MAG: DUF2460 domain-containing protein [Neorhizobium sp.]|nr:DUF2460 domain-containing protein [Neorhizobium sp.]